MSLNPNSPVTGSTVSGLTSPTYTITEDQSSNPNGRRWMVTALGGTQTGVETHSIGSPFYIDVTRPAQVKGLPRANTQTALYPSIPVNEFHVRVHKGVTISGGVGASQEATVVLDMKIRVPAGCELAGNDPEDLKAALSMLCGFMHANANGLYDLVSTGMLQ